MLYSFSGNDPFAQFAPFYFKSRFGGPGGGHRLEGVRSLVGLRRKLADLEKEAKLDPSKKFDRIEVFIHGNTTGVQTGDGTYVTTQRMIDAFGERTYAISTPHTQVRFLACSVGRRVAAGKHEEDASMMQVLAETLLPEGGSAVAATRNIHIEFGEGAATGFPPPARRRPRRGELPLAPVFAVGFGPALMIYEMAFAAYWTGLNGVKRTAMNLTIHPLAEAE